MRYGSGPVRYRALEPIWNGCYCDMKAFEIDDGGEIATAAEEPSGHTDRITHGYYPRPTPLLCSDTTFVPGEFYRGSGLGWAPRLVSKADS